MFTDGQGNLSKAQALSGAGAANSTNVIDLMQTTRDIAVGEPLCVCITVDIAAGGTAPTLQISAVESAAAALTSPNTLAATATLAAAALTAGARFYLVLSPGVSPLEFLGLIYTLGGTAPTVTVTANVIPLRFAQLDTYGASGINVQ